MQETVIINDFWNLRDFHWKTFLVIVCEEYTVPINKYRQLN